MWSKVDFQRIRLLAYEHPTLQHRNFCSAVSVFDATLSLRWYSLRRLLFPLLSLLLILLLAGGPSWASPDLHGGLFSGPSFMSGFPSNVGTQPSNGTSPTGSVYVIKTTVNDPDGPQDLRHIQLRVGDSNATGLFVYYNVQSEKLYLLDESGDFYLGGFSPGSPNLISHTRGALDCSRTTVEIMGNQIIVKWALIPSDFVGTHRLFQLVRDQAGNSTPLEGAGSWIIMARPISSLAPYNVSLMPTNISSRVGRPQLIETTVTDPNGVEDLRYVQLRIGDLNSAAIFAYYNVPEQKLYLLDDAGNLYLGGFAPGSPNVIQNSRGSLDCSATKIDITGNQVTVSFALEAKLNFTGPHAVYQLVRDQDGNSTSLDRAGSWTITTLPDSNVPPWNVSLAPVNGVSAVRATQFIETTVTDPNGVQDLLYVQLRIGTSNEEGIFAYYNVPQQRLYLLDELGNFYLGGFYPGSQNTISHSRGSLDCSQTTVASVGNNLTVRFALIPSESFQGTRDVFGLVRDESGSSTALEYAGKWTVFSGQNALDREFNLTWWQFPYGCRDEDDQGDVYVGSGRHLFGPNIGSSLSFPDIPGVVYDDGSVKIENVRKTGNDRLAVAKFSDHVHYSVHLHACTGNGGAHRYIRITVRGID